ncbi:bifunctional DNA primase/polymerase [Streptomyces europaeiscabiei]|uniref:bifunctional DNA primase/polymerase n=1 Tax=Streptomyces europaeiscabiei TaxID=146819 RepID=UPI0029C04E6E|nr:bifunctional DNA primase/polymerase [Streptomyces europaeiscabiei]
MTRRGIEWLSAAADDPATCRAVWADDPRTPCMLATGRFFDVVTVDQRLGLETFDQLVRRGLQFGPAMVDHGARRVGFFLSFDSHESFARFLGKETHTPPQHRYLSRDSVVVVPGPMPLPGDRYQWLRAPSRRPQANPLRPVALATMLVAAAELLARVDRYGEQYSTPYAAVAALPERAATDAG